MKTKLLLLLLVVLSGTQVSSQNFPDSYFESESGKLEYGFFVPDGADSDKEFPLIVFLHGWSNNYSVYLNWYDDEIQNANPCFVYTPKTPTDWADWSGWSDHLTEPMTVAIHVLDSLCEIYPVDKNRIYVYGISMGGEGTFDLLDKFPGKFAAAMSVCGGGKSEWADNVSKTPLWMFHGSADDINPPRLTEDIYNEMVRIGATKMRYTNYPGYGHDIWDLAESEPSWYDWMFAHSLNTQEQAKPEGELKLKIQKISDDQYKLSWNDIRDSNRKGNKIWYYKIFNSDGLVGTTEFDKTSFTMDENNSNEIYFIKAVNYFFRESNPSNVVSIKNSGITN